MIKIPKVELKTELRNVHPWIFSKMVKHPYPKLRPGTVVEVVDRNKQFIGRGFYHPTQTVAIRLLTDKYKEHIDEQFFYQRFKQAKEFREEILRIPEKSNSYRLIHSEGDFLSGIIIDKFNDVMIIEAHTPGVFYIGDCLVSSLKQLYPGIKVGFRLSNQIENEELKFFQEWNKRFPIPESTMMEENGVKFQVNFRTGHKTGYFLDQRENHEYAAKLSVNKEVFDLFSYTGGFGLTALSQGAKSVLCVDLDEKAIATARHNARINQLPGKEQHLNFEHMDAFNFLRQCIADKRSADIVIVDPSKLALVSAELSVAIRKYGDINKLALQVVRPGGILVTCSCSGLISEEKFLSIIINSAEQCKRTLQIFRVSGAAPDHPVSSRFSQGRYLKAVFTHVY